MSESTRAARGRRGRGSHRSGVAADTGPRIPYITRKIPYFEVLDEAGLQLIESNADYDPRRNRNRISRYAGSSRYPQKGRCRS